MLIWLLLLPLPATVLTTAAQPLAPRIRERCQELNVVSQHPATKNRVMIRCYTRGPRVSMLEMWFDDSDAPNADDRLTTVLMASSEGIYWYRLHATQLTFNACGLDTEGIADCLKSIGDDRPETDLRRDAEALAGAAAKIYSTGIIPDSIDGFSQVSTRSQELGSIIPDCFEWAVGAFWIVVGAVGLIIIHRRPIRPK